MTPEPGIEPIDPRTVPGPAEAPRPGPEGPRTPYPVNDPGIGDPTGPGSEPDYLPPGGPTSPTPSL